MPTTHAVVINCEFVPIGKRTGDPDNPKRPISFKVFPKGVSNLEGVIVGFPVLDVEPHGFGLVNMDTCWFFKGLGVYMPKAEIAERARFKNAVALWFQEPQSGRRHPPDSVRAVAESSTHHATLAAIQAGLCEIGRASCRERV